MFNVVLRNSSKKRNEPFRFCRYRISCTLKVNSVTSVVVTCINAANISGTKVIYRKSEDNFVNWGNSSVTSETVREIEHASSKIGRE